MSALRSMLGLDPSAGDEGLDADDVAATLLEKRQYRLHRRIERNRSAALLAKKYHGVVCEACGLDFAERYGVIGKGFVEAHHLRPMSGSIGPMTPLIFRAFANRLIATV